MEVSRSLSDSVVDWFYDELRGGKIKPLDNLPSERELCEKFGVSRTVVREALAYLKKEGVIDTEKGKRPSVSKIATARSFKVGAVSIQNKDVLQEIIEFLIVFEAGAAKIAASKRGDDDLKSIHHALLGMELAVANGELGDREDYLFHKSIVEATHNVHFVALNEHLDHFVRRLIREARINTSRYHNELVLQVLSEHAEIFKKIEDGDGEGAALAAENHLRQAAKRLDIYLKS